MKPILFAIILIAGMPAFANTYVKCGSQVDPETLDTAGYELELSSESDDYSGPVGGQWNLKLESEDSDWVKPNKNITATTLEKDGVTIVEVRILLGKTPTGPVGIRYKLIGLYDEAPVLEKYTFGGFAGTLKTATLQCVSAND